MSADNQYPKGEMPDPLPEMCHMAFRPDGVIGDSADKRFTYVQSMSDPLVIIEIDWEAQMGWLRRNGWYANLGS